MRKNSPRKWLHACLDLLPVILIPVFMIYSHRHDVAQDFVVTETEPVYYETNDVESVDDLVDGNIYTIHLDSSSTTSNNVVMVYDYNVIYGTFSSYSYTPQLPIPYLLVEYNTRAIRVYSDTQIGFYQGNFEIDFIYKASTQTSGIVGISACPRYVVKEYRDVSTNIPKDVMTSFMDRFNNTIDNYFNMGNVFNLTGVYEWFNTNIFNGNAPQIIYSVWNIALYELVMDLLFLLYGLFMWFIDIVQHLMDKPFKSIK